MKPGKTGFLLALVLLIASCAQYQGREKEVGGALVGAGLGALAGSQIGSGRGQLAAIAIGTLAGAWIGSEIGRSLDRADRLYAQQTAQHALATSPAGTTSNWQNPQTGHSGTVTPTTGAFQTATGESCRRFEQSVTVEGRTETAAGVACRQADGSWKIAGQ